MYARILLLYTCLKIHHFFFSIRIGNYIHGKLVYALHIVTITYLYDELPFCVLLLLLLKNLNNTLFTYTFRYMKQFCEWRHSFNILKLMRGWGCKTRIDKFLICDA